MSQQARACWLNDLRPSKRGEHPSTANDRPPTPTHNTIGITAFTTSTTHALAARMQQVLAALPPAASSPVKHGWLRVADRPQRAVGRRGLLVGLEDEQSRRRRAAPRPSLHIAPTILAAATPPAIQPAHPVHPPDQYAQHRKAPSKKKSPKKM